MNVTMPAVKSVSAVPGKCRVYLIRGKKHGDLYTFIRANNEGIFFDSNHLSFLSSNDGTFNEKWFTEHYEIVREFEGNDTLTVKA